MIPSEIRAAILALHRKGTAVRKIARLRGCKPKPPIFPAQQTFPFTCFGWPDLCPFSPE